MSYSAILSESATRRVSTRRVEKERWPTFRLVHEVEDVRLVGGFDGALVVVFGALEDLGQTGEVDAQRHRAVAAEAFEAGSLEVDGDERDVGIVHGLEVEALLVALKVGVGDELFDCYRGTMSQGTVSVFLKADHQGAS
jgi:hypothetical protein